jgi:hypothetical protein
VFFGVAKYKTGKAFAWCRLAIANEFHGEPAYQIHFSGEILRFLQNMEDMVIKH